MMSQQKTYSFKAAVYKTGINFAVDVPERIIDALEKIRGYIKVKGTINGFPFRTTLVPVKNGPYRLFTNMIMLKGAKATTGDTVRFALQQDAEIFEQEYPVPALLLKRLKETKLLGAFNALAQSRRKEILRYLQFVKTEETLRRNIEKLIARMEQGSDIRVP